MTFRVTRLNEISEVETVIQAGITDEDAARLVVATSVGRFLRDKYTDGRWELKWMPRRAVAMFVKRGNPTNTDPRDRRIMSWHIENER